MGWGPIEWVGRVLPEAKFEKKCTSFFEIFGFERPLLRYLLKTVLHCKGSGIWLDAITQVDGDGDGENLIFKPSPKSLEIPLRCLWCTRIPTSKAAAHSENISFVIDVFYYCCYCLMFWHGRSNFQSRN